MSNLYLKLDDAVKTVMKLYKNHGDLPVFTDDKKEEQMLYNEFYEVCDIPLMRGNEYQELAMRTANTKCKNLSNAALGLTGESGECADIVKKHLHHEHPFDKDHFVKELGDILWYVALGCEVVGVSMEKVMQLNIDKLRARYPDGFEADKSLHRAEGDI